MRDRLGGEIAVGDGEARAGGAQPGDDGGGDLTADGVVAEHAGVDVEQVHGRLPSAVTKSDQV